MRLWAGRRWQTAATPWRVARWCAVDLELTGLDPHHGEIIAIGAVPIEHGRVQLGQARYTLARPDRPPEHAAVLTHKLRREDLRDAPSLDTALDGLLEVLGERIPVFHAEAVERTFLTPLFKHRGLRLPAAADTQVLGRLWLRRRDGQAPAGLALSTLARELGQSEYPPHHALGDALTTAQAFIALANLLDPNATIRYLVGAADQLAAGRFAPVLSPPQPPEPLQPPELAELRTAAGSDRAPTS